MSVYSQLVKLGLAKNSGGTPDKNVWWKANKEAILGPSGALPYAQSTAPTAAPTIAPPPGYDLQGQYDLGMSTMNPQFQGMETQENKTLAGAGYNRIGGAANLASSGINTLRNEASTKLMQNLLAGKREADVQNWQMGVQQQYQPWESNQQAQTEYLNRLMGVITPSEAMRQSGKALAGQLSAAKYARDTQEGPWEKWADRSLKAGASVAGSYIPKPKTGGA